MAHLTTLTGPAATAGSGSCARPLTIVEARQQWLTNRQGLEAAWIGLVRQGTLEKQYWCGLQPWPAYDGSVGHFCHSRAGGNPRAFKRKLDSRLRGNDNIRHCAFLLTLLHCRSLAKQSGEVGEHCLSSAAARALCGLRGRVAQPPDCFAKLRAPGKPFSPHRSAMCSATSAPNAQLFAQ